MTIRFTRSACDRYTLASVSPQLKYCTPLYMLWTRRPAVAELEDPDGIVERPLFSISKTRTSASPAQVTIVLSLEWGMNLTEKIFAEWPVETVVLRRNWAVDESGW